MDEKKEFIVQPYNGKELAGKYNVSPKTFRNWLKRAGLNLGARLGNYYSPNQVKVITDHLGKPFTWIAIMWARWMIGDTDYDGLMTGRRS